MFTKFRNIIPVIRLAAAGGLMLSTAVVAEPCTCAPGFGGCHDQLPEFKQGARLLFIGDSITDMQRDRRPDHWDQNHVLGHSFVFLLAARLGLEMPEAELGFINRGEGGSNISQLRKRWQRDAIDTKPDVLTVLIGINDVTKAMKGSDLQAALASYEADYRHILTASRAANPELRIVLIDPFVLPVQTPRPGRDNLSTYDLQRQEVEKRGAVVARLAKEFDAVHVRMQDVFDAAAARVGPEKLLWDAIHPLPMGHELIARQWLQQVSVRWPRK